MIHRIKILLALIQELGRPLEEWAAHGLLFLFCREFVEHNHYYEFLLLPDGPRSLQAAADMAYLLSKGHLVADAGSIKPVETKKRSAQDLDFFEKIGIQKLKNTWAQKPAAELHAYIAEKYPATPPAVFPDKAFFTIGYEGRSPEAYINLLLENGVKLLCDVRRNPISKKFGFSKNELTANLALVGIGYQHIPELGIASQERTTLQTDADYHALFQKYEETTLAKQQDKLTELASLLNQHHRIAITCFEADVYHCHRSRVAKAMPNTLNFTTRITHL